MDSISHAQVIHRESQLIERLNVFGKYAITSQNRQDISCVWY